MRVKHIFHIVTSTAGVACTYTRTSDGKQISFRTSTANHIPTIPLRIDNEWRQTCMIFVNKMKAWQWRSRYADDPLFSDDPKETWKDIQKALKNQKRK